MKKTMATQISNPTEVLLVASGDSRPSANETCWPAQAEVERKLTEAFAAEGVAVRRAHPYNPETRHGFISSQRMGMHVFEHIHPDAPIVVAEAVWQYSAHVLAGLLSHRGPILTVANWSGQWPGLVGMLNLNGCLRKAGVPFTTLWSKDFSDQLFKRGLREWLSERSLEQDTSHVHALDLRPFRKPEHDLGTATGARTAAPQGHHGRIRRRLHGHV